MDGILPMKIYLVKRVDGTATILYASVSPEAVFAKWPQSTRDEHTGEYREVAEAPTGPNRHVWTDA